MNPCEKTALLTAYLLGDLPAREASELAAHLETCPACQAAEAEQRAALELLRDTLAPDREPPLRLDDDRRRKLLAVRPQRENWFVRRHSRLTRLAAGIAVVGGIVLIVSSSLFPAVSSSVKGAKRAAARDADKDAPSAGRNVQADASAVLGDRAPAAPAAPVAKEPSPSWLPERKKPAAQAAAAPAEPLQREHRFGLRRSTIDAPASGPATRFSPQPAAFDSVSGVKSPITVKGVYASRSPGARGGAAAGGGRPEDEQAAAAALASDVAVEFGGGELAKELRPSASAPKPDGKVRLNIELPKPQFTGTPKDIRSPNLETAADRLAEPAGGDGNEPVSKAKAVPDQSYRERLQSRREAQLASGETPAGVVGLRGRVLVNPVKREEAVNGVADAKRVSPLGPEGRSAVRAEPADADEGKKVAEKPRAVPPFNPFVAAADAPFSTFAIDVDTAGYTLTRQALRAGALPDPETVRTEEIVNALDYGDAAPEHAVFRVCQDGAQSPFGAGLNLLRIGVKGRRLGREEQRPAMLTFVVDVSGSMSQPDRIGLARLALRLLAEQLAPRDRLQIVAYSDRAQVALEAVAATEKARILEAFERLQCNGSTNLEEGLRQAYELAARGYVPGAENRVILISDGVANLGADSAQEILNKVSALRRQGITCSVFGVGAGTYNDRLLEELADKGDGVYRFLDSEAAVREAFVEDLAATLNTIAKDAKIQVEWNPEAVRRYRQLGYENRALRQEQFRDDAVDAGEVGSGQAVTALYELELAPGLAPEARLGTVRIRYQRLDTGRVEEIEAALSAGTVQKPARAAGATFRVAAAAAEFAELLRGSPHAVGGSFGAVADYLRPAALELSFDTRVKELLDLVTAAAALKR